MSSKLDRLVRKAKAEGKAAAAAAILSAYLEPPDHERAFRDFHWGNAPDRDVRISVEPLAGEVWQLGDLVSVTYETDKGGERAWWVHDFDDPPVLAASSPRQLIICPGRYRVTPRGIVG